MDSQRGHICESLQPYSTAEYTHEPNPQLERSATYAYQPITETSLNRTKTWKQRHLSGWHVGVTLFSIAALLVLVANICIAIYSVRQYGGIVIADFKPVFTGPCDKTKKLNTWIHFAINVLSSILLSGSNFSMQVLTAPTRKQIDNAHTKRRWLDIGIPSIRNLRSMGHGRRALWALILLTSAPLHLVYNSVFSQSWTRQAYEAALVTEDFLNGAPFDAGYTEPLHTDSDQRRLFGEIQKNASTYQRLVGMDCIKAYNKKAIIDRKTVLVVTSGPRPGYTLSYVSGPPAFLDDGTPNSIYATEDFVGNEVATSTWDWMCPANHTSSTAKCDLTDVLNGKEEWSPFFSGVKVDYCLSEYLGEQCTLDFSFGLMATVCICNLIKLICMSLVCFSRSDSPLLNIGDAVSSFLDAPDSTTTGMCLAGREQINQFWNEKGYTPPDTSLTWTAQSLRWFKACSRWRWVIFTVLSATSILIAAVLLAIGLKEPRTKTRKWEPSQKPWWQSGFGAANIDEDAKYAITYGHKLYQPDRLVANILLANLPQLVISFLFLAYNSIFTVMLMAKEWSDFGHERKTLRVTAPSGSQRSTYYLQLPYRYAIPLLVASMLLHWLTSQAIFLDRRIVQQVWWNEPYTDNIVGSVSTVGYSPLAVMLCLLLGIIMVVTLMALGFRKYKPGIPLAGSCSAAISAACHAPISETDASVLPLLWGVVEKGQRGGVGHCALSSREVSMPQPGVRYAGS